MSITRTPYPSDVSDEEWAFVAPYLVLLPEDAGQRRYPLREVFNGLRYIVRTGAHWRMMPHDLPPWPVVYQQMRRRLAADCFETIVAELRIVLRRAAERQVQPSAAILDSRTLQSTPESGAPGRAGYDGHKRRKGAKVHAAVDTLGHLLALVVTPAHEQDRTQVAELTAAVQAATGDHVAAVKLPEAKRGFVLLPRRWVVERGFAWTTRFRRLARDYERLAATLAALHFLAFACLMLHQFTQLMWSP